MVARRALCRSLQRALSPLSHQPHPVPGPSHKSHHSYSPSPQGPAPAPFQPAVVYHQPPRALWSHGDSEKGAEPSLHGPGIPSSLWLLERGHHHWGKGHQAVASAHVTPDVSSRPQGKSLGPQPPSLPCGASRAWLSPPAAATQAPGAAMPGHPTPRSPEAATAHTAGSGNGNGWGVAETSQGARGVASESRAEGTPRELCSADLVFRPGPQTKAPSLDLSSLRFGAQFTAHMLQIQWTRGHGWGAPLIAPVGPIPMHPAAQVLHYGMSCFEGMKAYKAADGSVRMFRPTKNMHRLAQSCHRLNLPAFDQGELLECLKELLRVESEWVPARDGFSVYLRPAMAATTPSLGVGPPSDALFWCLLSPAGPYFPDGLKPISLAVDTSHVRAFPGGVGDRKVAGNYAPTILPQVQAAARGCAQVLYVLKGEPESSGEAPAAAEGDAQVEEGLVGESGAMNVFFLLRRESPAPGEPTLELVTPPLDGLILPGVTRDSVLELVREWGGDVQAQERPIWLSELRRAHAEGRLLEMFGTGTAVIVQPISALVLASGAQMGVPVDEEALGLWTGLEPGTAHRQPPPDMPFSLTGRVYRALLDIQYGHVDHPWSVPV